MMKAIVIKCQCRKKRQQDGTCTYCGKPVIIQKLAKRGPYKCRGVSYDAKAYHANYYRQRLEKGLCSHCGKPNQDRPGKTICGSCHAKQNTKTTTTTL